MQLGVSSGEQRRWRFGAFELDVGAGQLRKHGVLLRIQEQPLRILALLLERQGQLVSRDELRLHLWGDDTFVDFDHGLNAAVTRLRQTLSDSAVSPRYVETVARKGYRFIATAEPVLDAAATAAPLPATSRPVYPTWRKRMVLTASVALLLICTATAILYFRVTPTLS